MYLLDTNVCIRFLNGRSPVVRERLMKTPRDMICVCSVVKAELYLGSAKSQFPEATRQKQDRFLAPLKSYDFDDAAAESYAVIRAGLEKQGTPIGPNDMMIAAIALSNRLTLISSNVSEFARISLPLALQCWETGFVQGP